MNLSEEKECGLGFRFILQKISICAVFTSILGSGMFELL